MGVIVRPDDLASIMAEVYARLDAIERTSGPMHDFAIRDPSGNMRVQGGNLAAWGISPAQEGMRVIDALGNPIFDTLGLSQVMQQLGTPATFAGSTVSTVAMAWADVSGSSVSFSLTRPAKVLVFADLTGSLVGAAGTAEVEVAIDGAYVGGAIPLFQGNSLILSPGMVVGSPVLAAGSHTATIQGATTTGASLTVSNGHVAVHLLGG